MVKTACVRARVRACVSVRDIHLTKKARGSRPTLEPIEQRRGLAHLRAVGGEVLEVELIPRHTIRSENRHKAGARKRAGFGAELGQINKRRRSCSGNVTFCEVLRDEDRRCVVMMQCMCLDRARTRSRILQGVGA